jgi:hypothetical protein
LTQVLKDPELGESEQFDLGTKFQFTMSGDVQTVIKETVLSKLLWTFTNVTVTDYVAFRTFFEDSLGHTVDVADHTGETWTGYFEGPILEISVDGRDESCEAYPDDVQVASFRITFIGARVPSWM